ncbi:MAG TPA: sigma-70 family RNA polymerase sigma factor [Lysobacter sp.]
MHAEAIDLLIRRELPAAAGGDNRAYGRIVAASQNAVTAVALAITRDVPASEDIAQEAFLSAWQNLQKLQNPASFLPWLRQITRNLARDHLRAHRRTPREVEDAEAAIAAAADPDPTPFEQMLQNEQQAVAAELISALPDDSREVLLLYYREGQHSQQVAALLGLSDAAVRKRLSRARASVREDLLTRFSEFARSSAPGAAFAALLTTALATASKPAAAAGLMTVGSGVAGGTLGKVLLGSLGTFGASLAGGVAGMYYGARYLLCFAENETERRAIKTFVSHYSMTSAAFFAGAVLATVFSTGWQALTATVLAGLVVLNYQLIVQLPRIMNPMLARDAARRPEGLARRRLAYRLVWGSSGIVISNIAMIGAFGLVLLLSGRFG